MTVIRCSEWYSSGYDAYLDSKRPGFGPPLRHRIFLIIRPTVIISYAYSYRQAVTCGTC